MVQTQQQLDAFWSLSKDKEQIRVGAAARIITQFAKDNREDQEHVIVRLSRGLSSSKDSARKGFFVAFVETLRSGDADQLEWILKKSKDTLQESMKGVKGSKAEEADILLGQLLLRGAMLRSGKEHGELVPQCVKEMLDIAAKRNFLRLPAYTFLIDVLKTEKTTESSFRKNFWSSLSTSCNWRDDSLSLESLWLLVCIESRFPRVLDKAFMLENFGRKTFLSEGFLSDLVKAKEKAYATTKLHILKQHPFFPVALEALQEKGLLETFWKKHLEPTLSKECTNKAMLSFFLIDQILNLEKAKKIALTFVQSVNFRETVLYMLARLESTPEIEALIFGVLAKISTFAKEDSKMQGPILRSLLTFPGSIAFDKHTGGNVILQLMSFASADCIQEVASLYKRAMLGEPDSGQARTAQERVYAAHQLAKLVVHPAMAQEEAWKVETLNFLLITSLFNVKSEVELLTSVPLPWPREARNEIKDVFFKALDLKVKNIDTLCTSLSSVAEFADKIMQTEAPVKPLDSACKKAWKQVCKDVKSTSKSSDQKDKVFRLLYLHMGFQLFSEPQMALETLADLRECQKRSKQIKDSKTTKSNEDHEPQWVEVIVDLLVSLLSQNKHVLRQLANFAFTLIAPHMTSAALQHILDAISQRSDPDQDEDDSDDDENDESDYETEEEEMEIGDQEEDDEDDEDEHRPGEEDDNDPDQEFVTKMKAALGEHADNSSAEDSDDDNEVDMDAIPDEDMEKLDNALVAVFRQLGGKKGSAEKRKEAKDALALLHFRMRIVEMLDIYVKNGAPFSHVLAIIGFVMAKLQDIQGQKELAPLQERLKVTLRVVTNLKKPATFSSLENDADFSEDGLVDTFQSLVDFANSGSPLMGVLSQPLPLFAQTTTLLLKFAQEANRKALADRLHNIYSQALEDFFHKPNCVLPLQFFQRPIEVNYRASWQLAPALVENGFSAKTLGFRRTHAMALLSSLFHNRELQDSAPQDLKRKLVTSLESHLVKELSAYGESGDLKPKYMCELLNVLHGLHLSKAECNWSKICPVLEAFGKKVPANRYFQDFKKAYNKIAVPLKVTPIVGSKKKRKRTESMSIDEPKSKAKARE